MITITFGTDGFRGVIGRNFTFDSALLAGRKALGWFAQRGGRKLAIGYDTRFLSPEIAREMAAMASSCGFDVDLSDTFCPSPALSLYVHERDLDLGLMITASHNPPVFNGVKVKEPYGGSAVPETMAGIAAADPAGAAAAPGHVSDVPLRAFYLDRIKRFVPFNRIVSRPVALLADVMHGSAAGWLPELFSNTAVTVTELHGERNPSFGGTSPEPIERNLGGLRDAVRGGRHDLAVAFDGDGDRIAAYDGSGLFLSSQRLMPLFLEYLATVRGATGCVVKTVSTSHMVDAVATRCGVPLREVPIGFKNIVPFFLSGEAMLGGEESGGMAVKGYIPERDALFCTLFLLEILDHHGKGLGELWAAMEERYGSFMYDRRDFHFHGDEDAVRRALSSIDLDAVAGVPVASRNFTDGRKFILDDGGFLLLRVSGTEPVVRVYAEASSDGRLADVLDWAARFLRERGVEA